MDDVRITTAVAVILHAFVEDVARPQYGYGLMKTTGYASGKLYPILARLEAAGWLTTQWNHDGGEQGRRPRLHYRLTEEGAVSARIALAALRQERSPIHAGPGVVMPAGGTS